MKFIPKIAVASLASFSLIVPAMADVIQPIDLSSSEALISSNSLDNTDFSYAFGDGQDLQVMAISKQEMEDTEGAAIWFAPVIAGGARYALNGFTRHGLNQAISRQGVGVSNKAILNTLRNPTKITSQSGGRTRFTGPEGGVVLNNQGKVITTWGKPRSR